MNRVRTHREREAIGAVLGGLPAGVIRALEGIHYISEVSPVFMGASTYRSAPDGRSFDTTSHVLWEQHQHHLARSDRATTVVLLDGDAFDPLVVLHEIGHALDERMGYPSRRLPIVPLGEYAATNRCEAFATSFQAWATRGRVRRWGFFDRSALLSADPRTALFFDSIAEEVN